MTTLSYHFTKIFISILNNNCSSLFPLKFIDTITHTREIFFTTNHTYQAIMSHSCHSNKKTLYTCPHKHLQRNHIKYVTHTNESQNLFMETTITL